MCIRRSNDLSQDTSFVPSPTIDGHKDATFGTHHARDVVHLYRTQNVELQGVFSSALKLNTQYMHTIYFTLELERPTTMEAMRATMDADDRIAVTWKRSVNSATASSPRLATSATMAAAASSAWPSSPAERAHRASQRARSLSGPLSELG